MTLVPLHVIGGVIAIATGFVALYALKGATLVITSLTTVRPSFAGSLWLDRGAMLAAFALGLTCAASAFGALAGGGRMNGGLTFPLLMFSVVAISADPTRGAHDNGVLTLAPPPQTDLLQRSWRHCT